MNILSKKMIASTVVVLVGYVAVVSLFAYRDDGHIEWYEKFPPQKKYRELEMALIYSDITEDQGDSIDTVGVSTEQLRRYQWLLRLSETQAVNVVAEQVISGYMFPQHNDFHVNVKSSGEYAMLYPWYPQSIRFLEIDSSRSINEISADMQSEVDRVFAFENTRNGVDLRLLLKGIPGDNTLPNGHEMRILGLARNNDRWETTIRFYSDLIWQIKIFLTDEAKCWAVADDWTVGLCKSHRNAGSPWSDASMNILKRLNCLHRFDPNLTEEPDL